MLVVWPLVPIYHSLGLGIALFSYSGNVHWGFLADRDLVPDLDRFVAGLEATAADYLKLAKRLSAPVRRLDARPAAATRSGASRPRARARGRDTPRG
jgi:hypothetical protein